MDSADPSSRTELGPVESPAAVRVVIADDHTIFRKGLRSVLEAETEFARGDVLRESDVRRHFGLP